MLDKKSGRPIIWPGKTEFRDLIGSVSNVSGNILSVYAMCEIKRAKRVKRIYVVSLNLVKQVNVNIRSYSMKVQLLRIYIMESKIFSHRNLKLAK